MSGDVCWRSLCVGEAIPSASPSIFGFSDFLSVIALLLVLYMVAEPEHRFRVAINPLSQRRAGFFLIAALGALALLTDLWVAERWWVLRIPMVTEPVWRTMLGLAFMSPILLWVYFAFVRPPVFGVRNASRYAHELFQAVVRGNDAELAALATEVGRSARQLVTIAAREKSPEQGSDSATQSLGSRALAARYAHDILLLLGNRKLCRNVVESAPGTAIKIFEAMSAEGCFHVPVSQFAKNVSAEALGNTDSLMYHEGAPYSSGLLGFVRPWTTAVFGNYRLVEALAGDAGGPLDIDHKEQGEWNGSQWHAFGSAVLETLKSYLADERGDFHSHSIHSAFEAFRQPTYGIYQLDGIDGELFNNELLQRFSAVVDFACSAVKAIDESEFDVRYVLRRRGNGSARDVYDEVAELMFDAILGAASVRQPADTSWWIQHNIVWSNFFGYETASQAGRIVQFKLRRLLYNEIAQMETLPNYKGARVLRIALNVGITGVDPRARASSRSDAALVVLAQRWARKHFLSVHETLPVVAETILCAAVTFDESHSRLVKTFIQGLSREPSRAYLDLEQLWELEIPGKDQLAPPQR